METWLAKTEKLGKSRIQVEWSDEERAVIVNLMYELSQYLTLLCMALGKKPEGFKHVKDILDTSLTSTIMLKKLGREKYDFVFGEFVKTVSMSMMAQHFDENIDDNDRDASGDIKKAQLAKAFKWLEPMLDRLVPSDGSEEKAFSRDLREAMNALEAGEMPEIFAPSRKKGKETNSYTLNKLRLEISLLVRNLDRKALRTHDINVILVDAVGNGWDTVSRWRGAALKVLNVETITELEGAVNDRSNSCDNEKVIERIRQRGQEYKNALRKIR